MNKDILIENHPLAILADWIADRCSQTIVLPTGELMTANYIHVKISEMEDNAIIKVHGYIQKDLSSPIKKIRDIARIVLRQGGDNRVQVVIESQAMFNDVLQKGVIDQLDELDQIRDMTDKMVYAATAKRD